ncbi:MAG TPA: PQQ-binding-like beta-propeller repeat protein [Polyangiaceae bacterium]|nr:PQQ-binding-like beta-propeller repeat protein [Polyangiaceae bacterium]
MRHALAVGAALGLAASLFGCESVRSSVVSEQPTWYRRPGWFLSVERRRPVTDPNQLSGEEYERGQPELDPQHQRIFVGSADRGLYALRADDLSTLWRFSTAGVVQGEPLYDPGEDVVYFGSHDGALYKVRAVDGGLVWRFNTNSEVARRPLRAGNLLYVVNANDTLMAIEPDTGKLRWHYHRAPALGIEMAGYAGPAVANGMAYAAFSDGRVSAFDAVAGTERWSVDLAAEAEQSSGELPRQLDVDATPIAARINAGPAVFVASYPAGVFALDAQSGGRLWSNSLATGANEIALWEEPAHAPRGGGPAVAPKRLLLVSSASTGLWALDVETGQEVWRRPLPEGGLSAVVPAAGALLVATSRYGLFLVSPLDGAVIDGVETGSGFASTPAAFGRRAFALTNQGVLLSIVIDAPWRSARPAREPYVRLGEKR